MFQGEPTEGLRFYALLYADDEFCRELGRTILAAGRLESALRLYMTAHAPDENTTNATLGRLISCARKHQLLLKMLPVLETLKAQRNYLAHNVHALFAGLVEETILESSGLRDSDVVMFTERAWQLRENLNALANVILES